MTEPTPIRDFTLPMEPIRFRVDQDEFTAPAFLSPVVLKRFAARFAEVQPLLANPMADIEAAMNGFADLFVTLIPGESGQRLHDRLLSEDHPIDLTRQALPILFFLMESWGLRPTQPSLSSPDGSATPSEDTSSTAGASPEASDRQS